MFNDLSRFRFLRGPRRQSARRPGARWELLALEDRTVPSIGYATGSGVGLSGSPVNVYDTSGALLIQFSPFPGFFGGSHVAVGDLNGDGEADLVVGAGPGGTPHVKVYDGASLSAGGTTAQLAVSNPLKSFYAYATSISAGVNVAVGNINGDADPLSPTTPANDIVTGPGTGVASNVKVFNFSNLAVLYNFYAYDPSLACGVDVAAGNVGGDTGNPPIHPLSSDELITSPQFGGGPHVKVYSVSLTDITKLDLLGQFYAYQSSYFGGVTVASGHVTNNRDSQGFLYADIVTGTGLDSGPHVKVLRLLDANPANPPGFYFTFNTAASFFAYDAGVHGGVNVGVTPNLDGDANNTDDIITAPGPGAGPHVKQFAGQSLMDLETYTPPQIFPPGKYAYPSTFTGGVYVA